MPTLAFSGHTLSELLRRDCFLFAIDPDHQLPGSGRGDPVGSDLAIFPLDIDCESAAGAQAFDVAVGPDFGQGREQMELVLVTLEEHLADAGSVTEVAINLERWMGVEKFGMMQPFKRPIASL